MRVTKNISKTQIEKVIEAWRKGIIDKNKNDCKTKEKENGWVELKCQKNKDNRVNFDW